MASRQESRREISASGVDDECKWETGAAGDTPPLTTESVQALYEPVENLEDELLVVALAVWGFPANEVESLHMNQLERKTGSLLASQTPSDRRCPVVGTF